MTGRESVDAENHAGPVRPRPPSPAQQIHFLRQLQRLLDEGSFTASYKYALLHAIADLCVARADGSGAELPLHTRDIAERFVRLYWRQVRPFPAAGTVDLLSQNTGRQAKIVRELSAIRGEYAGRLADLRRTGDEWDAVVRSVEETVRKMPLWRLQTLGQEEVEFLYANEGRGRTIVLRPGVAYCFSTFYPLVVDMVEGAWAHFVRRLNPGSLGDPTDLRSFLFGSERIPLAPFRPLLRDLQEDHCFYCANPLGSRKAEVDHFIPWRRYPTDLGHNFVLAHARCNARKGDRLAAEPHLARWRERNVAHGEVLSTRFAELGVHHDLETTWQVARWAYRQVDLAGGQVWMEGSTLLTLTPEWREILEVQG